MGRILKKIQSSIGNQKGIGTIEVILILVVLIALVILFREQILSLVDVIFVQINSTIKEVY